MPQDIQCPAGVSGLAVEHRQMEAIVAEVFSEAERRGKEEAGK